MLLHLLSMLLPFPPFDDLVPQLRSLATPETLSSQSCFDNGADIDWANFDPTQKHCK
jgi:hypothetical protein